MSKKAKNASQLFVEALENEGVERIYGVPGEENLYLLDAIKDSSIELILTRHEQGAGFMAATYGRLTGKAGVCLATLGPGATNLITAGAYAQLGAFPMVMITGQKPIKTSKQGQFQIIDVVGMMRPITKYTKQLVDANLIPNVVREAFRVAQEERPGAVHIEFPEDISEELVADDAPSVIFPSKRSKLITADRLVDDACEAIKKAKFPLLLVGAGANRKKIHKSLSDFVEKTGLYFFNTQMGKGVLSEDSPHYIGTAALSDNDYIHCAIDRADLIINVGHDVIEKPPFFMSDNKKQVIHVNFSSASVDIVYHPQLEVLGDIATSLQKMTKKLDKLKQDFSYFKRVKDYLNEHISEGKSYDDFPIKPQKLVHQVRDVMPADGIIALDNGAYKLWFARNYPALLPNTILLDNALATMGAGLPSAMEVSRLYPKRRVMSICGDGGFMMNSQEMETAVRLKLNFVILVLRDDSYGMIRWKQYGLGMDDYGLQFGNPDFVKYAEAYGAHGHRIAATKDFPKIVNKCFEDGGVHLIDVPIDYSENNKVLIDELKEKVCLV